MPAGHHSNSPRASSNTYCLGHPHPTPPRPAAQRTATTNSHAAGIYCIHREIENLGPLILIHTPCSLRSAIAISYAPPPPRAPCSIARRSQWPVVTRPANANARARRTARRRHGAQRTQARSKTNKLIDLDSRRPVSRSSLGHATPCHGCQHATRVVCVVALWWGTAAAAAAGGRRRRMPSRAVRTLFSRLVSREGCQGT